MSSVTERVPRERLQREWEENHMPAKRNNPAFSLRERVSPATNSRWLGGTSRIVRIFTPNGRHIGTLHEIVLPDGSVPHSHPKDYTRRYCAKIAAG